MLVFIMHSLSIRTTWSSHLKLDFEPLFFRRKVPRYIRYLRSGKGESRVLEDAYLVSIESV